jgi:hypothetical protein
MPRGKTTGTHDVPYPLRCAVVALRFHSKLTFNDIASKLGLHERTVARIYQHAELNAPLSSFLDILACVGALEKEGRPPKVLDGTQQSADIHAMILQYFDFLLEDLIPYTGVRMGRATIEQIAHEHRDEKHDFDIVRRVQPLIPALAAPHFDSRLTFCRWALPKARAGAIFIFTDESYIEIGGNPRKKPKVSMPKGCIDTFKYALPVQKEQFGLMIWAAVCACFDGDFPIVIWEQYFESEEEEVKNNQELAEMNQQRRTTVLNQQANCHIQGTEEYEALSSKNAEIDKENIRRRETRQRGRLQRKRPAQLYPFEEMKRERKKGGIDWFLYRKKVR